MASLNKVQLIGNCGNEPEVKTVGQNNTKFCRLSLAVTESYKDRDGQRKENTEWFTIVTFGNLAEIISKYAHKGSRLYIEGRLKTRRWTDENGEHFTTEVHAREIILLDSKPRTEKPATDTFQESDNDLPW